MPVCNQNPSAYQNHACQPLCAFAIMPIESKFYLQTCNVTCWGIPKNIKRGVFGQKPTFLEPSKILPFSQFLSNFLPKGLIEREKANALWTPQAEKPQVNRKLRTDFRTWNVQGPISFFGSPRIFFVRRQKKPGRHSRYGYWSENLGNVAQSHSKLQFNDFFPGFHQKKLENWSISKKLKSKSCLELIFMFT